MLPFRTSVSVCKFWRGPFTNDPWPVCFLRSLSSYLSPLRRSSLCSEVRFAIRVKWMTLQMRRGFSLSLLLFNLFSLALFTAPHTTMQQLINYKITAPKVKGYRGKTSNLRLIKERCFHRGYIYCHCELRMCLCHCWLEDLVLVSLAVGLWEFWLDLGARFRNQLTTEGCTSFF